MGIIILKNRLFTVNEKRNYIRKRIAVPVIYGYLMGHTFINNDGITFDVSTGGISFYSDKPLIEGNNINIYSSYLWNCPRIGTVQWCSRKTCSLYKTGILFR